MGKPMIATMRVTLAVLALATGVASVQPLRAQTTDTQQPDIKEMQKKLQEQQADNNEMQKKLEYMEQEIRELKMQMAEQPKKETGAIMDAAFVTQEAPSKPAETEKKSGGGSTLDFYGYVMLDAENNFGTTNPNWFDVMRPTQLPAFAGEFAPNGSAEFSVRQTRFGVKSSTDTPFGELKTIFEFELFGTGVDAGQTTFRLRHAYGELGHFGAGQTWSAFMDIDVFPNSLEYWGPNGMVFFRNLQVRWTPIQGASNVVIALERPGASADGGIYSDRLELQNIVPQFKWPDLTGHARLARGWGYVQLAGIVRKIAWVDTHTIPSPFNLSGTAIGWGVNVTSNLNFTKKDTGKFEVVYGEGIENYMNDAPVDVGPQNNFSNPISPIIGLPLPVLGVVSFLDHNWNEKLSTSIGYSLVNISNSGAQAPSDYHQGDYALTNLLFHPVKKVTIGGEFQFGRRVNYLDGYNYNDYKLQFSFRYDWAKQFEF